MRLSRRFRRANSLLKKVSGTFQPHGIERFFDVRRVPDTFFNGLLCRVVFL